MTPPINPFGLLFSPRGRFTRGQWWMVGPPASVVIVIGAVFYVDLALGGPVDTQIAVHLGLIAVIIFWAQWASITAAAKRLRDLGRSGGWAVLVLLIYVPVASPWLQIAVLVAMAIVFGLVPGRGRQS